MSLPPPIPPSPHTFPPVAMYAARPPTDDIGHLKLLAIFHFVLAGITALFACFPFVHIVMGLAMVNGKFGNMNGNMHTQTTFTQSNGISMTNQQPDMAWMGWMFVVMGGLFILIGWALALLTLISGFKIKNRRGRTFSIVVAGAMCVFFPFGTTLGVFTLIVLLRDSVKGLYAQEQSMARSTTAETA